MTDRVDINRLLVEMRAMKNQATAFQQPEGLAARDVSGSGSPLRNPLDAAKAADDIPSFGEMMETAVNKVNSIQKQSGALSSAYVQGDPNVDVTDVMIASQKASVAFQSMVQVRNRLVDAYRDVMNMPV